MESDASEAEPPTLYIASNGWQPVPMIDAVEFTKTVDPKVLNEPKPDILQILRDQGKIPKDVMKYEDLTRGGKKLYKNEEIVIENAYRKRWAKVLLRSLKYKSACLVNPEDVIQLAKRKEQVYAYACFLKPGKHSIFVTNKDEFDNTERTLQTFIVDTREEPVP